jgi:dinuclear metal center YbgI/SA1388 family protein
VGLQVGSLKQRVSNIFLCLELTPKSLDEALKKKADFIFTHHPFIFKPLKKVNTDSDPKGILIKKLIENNITLYSAHTNLDFTKDGVSFELAKNLRLENPEFLVNQKSNQYKLVVFVPQNHLDNLSKALFKSGAGIIGEYDSCSFQNEGIGTFKGSEFSNPAVGKKENFEKADEIRLELLVDSWKLNNVIKALKKTHPYEEPAFDIYPLNNENQNYGYGVLGYLKKSMSQNEFLSHLCKSLKTNNLRYSIGKSGKIKSVAVCGGSGSDLLASAIKRKADAFVTADLKYHTFQDGEGQILFVDAGHYETEIHVLNIVKKKLEKFVKEKGEKIGIIKYSRSTNPIKFFNNKGVK